MNFFASKRLVAGALVLLTVMNITLLGVLLWQNTCRMGSTLSRHQWQDGHGTFLAPLALTPSQSLSFRQLRQKHFLKVRPEMKNIALLKQELIEESLKELPDEKKITTIAETIGSHQVTIERELAKHFHELGTICTPPQRDSLKQVLNRIATHKKAMRNNHAIDFRP